MEQPVKKVILTPSFAPYKIVLLTLIAAYCAGILPKKTHRPLLTTVVKYIERPSIYHETHKAVNVPTLDEILSSIKESCLKADPIAGVEYSNDIELRLLHALWSLKSLDSLYTFIFRARSFLVKNVKDGKQLMQQLSKDSVPRFLLTRSSFLGQFVTTCIASFETLEFDKSELLWTSFVNFRKSSQSKWVKKHSQNIPDTHDFFGTTDKEDDFSHLTSIFECLPLNGIESKEEVVLISQEDLSKLIDHQVHIFETYGTATSPELRQTLASMTQAETGKLPSIYYIRYLECLRDADYEGAFHSLHRYFDYMMSNRRTVFYHYALLCLATLHAAFDCEQEAIRAIEEAISVARENKDTACLNFVLSWLFNFLKDRPHLKHNFYVSNAHLLQFLKTNTGSTSYSLHSTAYQSEATQIILEGGSISSALESLTKAAHISLTEDSSLVSFISYCALASAIWFRLGNFELAKVYCEISLESSTSITQKVSIFIRKASVEYALGNTEEAFRILEDQKALVSSDLRLNKELVSNRLLLLARQCIRSSRYKMAQYYLEKLEAQQHVNIDTKSELQYLTACLHLKIRNLQYAFEIVSEQTPTFAQKSTNKFWFLKFSLLHCDIIGQISAPARSLSGAVKCIQAASKSGYTLLVLEAVLSLVEILMKLNEYEDARGLLYDSAPYYEQVSDLELKSKSHQAMAKNLIMLYKIEEQDKKKKIEQVTRIVEHLEKSIDGFKRLSMFEEMKKCLELQINIAQRINHEELLAHAQASLISINNKIREESSIQS